MVNFLKKIALAFAIGLLLGALAGKASGQVNQKAMVSFEFDDGFQSGYDFGIPYFAAAGYPITQCIITGHLNTPNYMTTQEVINVDTQNGNETCAHTRNHYDLATLTPQQQSDEILGGKADLEAIIGHPVTSFAYPFGHHNNSAVGYVMLSGVQSAGTVYGTTNPTSMPYYFYNTGANYATDPMILPRFPMVSTTSSSYAHSLVDYSINHQKWIVILFHRVDETGNDISVTHQFIQDLILYVQSKGTQVTVVTRSQGVATLGLQQLQK